MKKYILLAATVLSSTAIFAGQRPETSARQIAASFVQQKHLTSNLELVPSFGASQAALPAKPSTSSPVHSTITTPYYIYNNVGGGYVIISGTDQMLPVIAYSDHGSIDVNAPMPDGLKYWLGYAAEAVSYADMHPEAALTAAARQGDWQKDYAPLLGNIQFDQSEPYNMLCPGPYTGCMATAMSQVMAYHKWPTNPTGYVGQSNGVSVNLDQQTYNWDLVLPTYKGGAGTIEEQYEVAKLHYHVGLSLNMEYQYNQSGSVSTMYVNALVNNFKYNSRTVLLNRDNFTYGEWVSILLNEFENQRPVIYDGVSMAGGHAFVIDGYQAANGFFHVNWGWEGMSDGYYDITLLDPPVTGAGASLSNGFTSYQDMVINITPEEGAGEFYHSLFTYGAGNITSTSDGQTIALGQKANLGMNEIYNFYSRNFRGEFGALIMQGDQEIARVPAGTVFANAATMNVNYRVETTGGDWTIPTNLEEGKYRVYIYIKEDGSSDYAKLRVGVARANYLDMIVSHGQATFIMPWTEPTDLQITEWSFEKKSPTYRGMGLEVSFEHVGDMPEQGFFIIDISAPNLLPQRYLAEPRRITPGQKFTLNFPIYYETYGEYTINNFVLVRDNGCGSALLITEPIKFSVYPSVEECLSQLNDLLEKCRKALNDAVVGNNAGQYPAEDYAAFKAVYDRISATDTSNLSAAELTALLQELQEAYDAFKAAQNYEVVINYWGYAPEGTPDTGWSGSAVGGTVYVGISASAEQLAPYIGSKVVGIRAWFGSAKSYLALEPGELTAQVMLLDYDGSAPGDHILAQSDQFSPVLPSRYEDYMFNRPYTIGTGGLFGVCALTMNSPHYASIAAYNSVITPGACWMNSGGGWEDMYYSYGSFAAGHAMKLIISGQAHDVVDLSLDNLKATAVSIGEDIHITGVAQNFGKNPVTSYELRWTKDDGQTGTVAINTNMANLQRGNFSITIPGFSTAALHKITVEVTKINGEDDMVPDNSTAQVYCTVTDSKFVRNVVVEENTGTNCPWCPRGIVAFETMKEKYGSHFIGVSIHRFSGADPMYYNNDKYATLLPHISSAPTGIVDRKQNMITSMYPNEVESFYLSESETCVAAISNQATYDPSNNRVHVSNTTEFGYDFSNADYRISYLVLEDGVGPYQQLNNYAGGAYGAMGGWESKSTRVSWIYDDVARDIQPSFAGQANSVPTSVVANQEYSSEYSFVLTSDVVNWKNVRIVSLLLDSATGEIINAAQCQLLEGTVSIEAVTADEVGANADSQMFDLMGRRVNGAGHGLYIMQGKKVIR